MTPLEEQVEKLAWEWGESAKQLEALARSGGDEESAAWVAGASAAREEDIDDLRTLLPLEVTDESVTVTLSREEIEAVFEAMSTGYSHEGPMDQHLKAVYPKLREALLACLPPSPRRERHERDRRSDQGA